MSNTLWVSPNGVTVGTPSCNADQKPNENSIVKHAKNTPIDHPDLSVSEEKIAQGAVSSDKIKNGAVNTDKLADASVTSKKIASSSVTAEKIASKSVTTAKLGDRSITTDKIADNAVTTEKIANASVTGDKLADKSVSADKLADFIMTKDNFADSSVSSSKLASESVTTSKIADNAIISEKIADDAVTLAKLAPLSVDADKLCDGAVTSDKLAVGSVSGDIIAGDTVTGDKIAMNTITSENLSDNCVSVNELADNSVSCDKLCEGAVTMDKLDQEVLDSFITKNDGKVADDLEFDGNVSFRNVNADSVTSNNSCISLNSDTYINGTLSVPSGLLISRKYNDYNGAYFIDSVKEARIDITSISAAVNNKIDKYIDIFVSGKNFFGGQALVNRICELFDNVQTGEDYVTFTPDSEKVLISGAFMPYTKYTFIIASGFDYDGQDTGLKVVYTNGSEKKLMFDDGICMFTTTSGSVSHIATYSTEAPIQFDQNYCGIYYETFEDTDDETCERINYRIDLIDENLSPIAPLKAISSDVCDRIVLKDTTYMVERNVASDGKALSSPSYTKLAPSVCNTLKNIFSHKDCCYVYAPSDMVSKLDIITYSSVDARLARIESALGL